MKKSENIALHKIMNDLNAGFTFGRDCTWNYYENKPLHYPYFHHNLYITPRGNIGWNCSGSSANKKTLEDLHWVITVIFRETPETFLEKYIRNDNSKIERGA